MQNQKEKNCKSQLVGGPIQCKRTKRQADKSGPKYHKSRHVRALEAITTMSEPPHKH